MHHRLKRLGGCLLALLCIAAAPSPQLVDRVAAVVEDDIITVRELEALAGGQLEEVAKQGSPAVRQERRRTILARTLDSEIGERMLQREVTANRDRLAVSDKDVDHAIDEVARLNHVDREQLQEALFAQGMNMAEYRNKMRSQLERTRLIQFKVQGRVQVKDIDITRRCHERQRFEAREPLVCAEQLFVSLPADADRGRLQSAEAALKKQRSQWLEGRLPRHMVAELGCFRRGEMLEAIDAVAFELPLQQASEPIHSPLGLHVVKVIAHRAIDGDDCGDAAVRERFRGELYQEEMQRQMVVWTEELRKKAFVEVRLDGSE